MAEIPYSGALINDLEVSSDAPLTEALMEKMAGNSNRSAKMTLKVIVFTANGTLNVPVDVSLLMLEAIGGGGGGLTDNIEPSNSRNGFGGEYGKARLAVTPGSSINVQIGAGGAASSGAMQPGGNTVVGGLTFNGSGSSIRDGLKFNGSYYGRGGSPGQAGFPGIVIATYYSAY